MARPALRACVLVLVPLVTSPGAPLPKDTRPVIAPETVNRLKPVAEMGFDAFRVVWGPQPGEVTLLSWTEPPVILDDRTLKPVRKLPPGKKPIHLAASADREAVAWVENNTQVEVQFPKAGTAITIETGQPQPDVAFSPDGKLLATGGYGTTATIWEIPSGKRVRDLDAGGTGGLAPVFSRNGKILAVGNRNDVPRLYEVKTGKLLHILLGKSESQGMKFSPDDKLLAVGYVDGTVGLWDVETGKLVRSAPAKVKEV
jgi:WD40 repeat protein